MLKYPSIETVFMRGEDLRLEFGNIRMPEVACVHEWELSEKIDGTNVRVIWTLDSYTAKGRTDRATLSDDILEAVVSCFPSHERVIEYFTAYRGRELRDDWSVTFYGEAFGPGIQKGGGVYGRTKAFRCFDLMLGGSPDAYGKWTDDCEMRRVCAELGVPVVPHVGYTKWIPRTQEELKHLLPESVVAREAGNPGVLPEGVVAKPPAVLLDRHGERVMWKLTHREWKPGKM